MTASHAAPPPRSLVGELCSLFSPFSLSVSTSYCLWRFLRVHFFQCSGVSLISSLHTAETQEFSPSRKSFARTKLCRHHSPSVSLAFPLELDKWPSADNSAPFSWNVIILKFLDSGNNRLYCFNCVVSSIHEAVAEVGLALLRICLTW